MAKMLTDLEWVKLAASRDEMRAKGVLCGIHVREDGVAEATDGHRFHRAPVEGFPAGLWHRKTGAAIGIQAGSRYPGLDAVTPIEPGNMEVTWAEEFVAVCSAAVAYHKIRKTEFPAVRLDHPSGVITLDARYLLDALRIDRKHPEPVLFRADGPHLPIRFDFLGGAQALIMPIRSDATIQGPRFDIDPDAFRILEEVAA